ncbi:putative uncharacterized protein DDB_G0271606 [Zophobas morio]|uniref:putative uncharacterized protein DDB_G0271606 n=1 Tax=Zophobas morio TaxID=2755281 RepID=UPI003083640F
MVETRSGKKCDGTPVNENSVNNLTPEVTEIPESISEESARSNPIMALSLETAERMLIKFDGTRSLLYEFIDNCDTALESIDNNKKEILFSIIKTKLTGKARELTRSRQFTTWNSLKDHLVEIYADRRTQAQWQLELNSCKQRFNEDVSLYASRVENCCTELINSLSTTLTADAHKACVDLFKTQALNVFVAGLTKDLALLVKAQKPDSLEDAISIAINEEQEIRSKIEIQKFRSGSLSGQFCNFCRKSGHSITNCRNKFNNRNLHNNRSYGNSSKYDNRNGNNCSTNDNTNNSNLNFPGPSSLPAPLKATHILQAGSQL